MCIFYLLFAVCGTLIMGTLAVLFVVQNAQAGPLGVVWNFLRDASTNLASQFIYADLVLIWAGLGVFMIVEARRYGIRHVWAYIVGAPALALCAAFALFMYVRQLKIAAEANTPSPPAAAPPRETPPREMARKA